jgi:energy-coupling factor transporter ATP-binding protein EcfA2
MLLKSITLRNQHTIPLRSLNLIIGPNNSGKSSLLTDLQSLTVTGILLDSYDPKGLTEEQIHHYLDSKNDYRIPAPVSVQGGDQLRTKRVKPLLGMVFRDFFQKRRHGSI